MRGLILRPLRATTSQARIRRLEYRCRRENRRSRASLGPRFRAMKVHANYASHRARSGHERTTLATIACANCSRRTSRRFDKRRKNEYDHKSLSHRDRRHLLILALFRFRHEIGDGQIEHAAGAPAPNRKPGIGGARPRRKNHPARPETNRRLRSVPSTRECTAFQIVRNLYPRCG